MNKKYWLIGGILSVIIIYLIWTAISTLFFIIINGGACSKSCIQMTSVVCSKSYSACIYTEHFYLPFITDFFPNSKILDQLNSLFSNSFARFIYSFIMYFFIGSIFGWIYGKFKNRNKSI
jgi:hypothetical protein